jgi:hypothetical protein
MRGIDVAATEISPLPVNTRDELLKELSGLRSRLAEVTAHLRQRYPASSIPIKRSDELAAALQEFHWSILREPTEH